jgi:hypothetical protein
MAPNANNAVSRNIRDLVGRLAPLANVDGVQDYLLADSYGRILARKPGSSWDAEIASAYAKDMAQAAEVVRLLPMSDNGERLFDFHFDGAQLIVWDFGKACLVALCGRDSNRSIARMTVNVIKEELRKDKRFRDFFGPPPGSSRSLLTEEDLGSELSQQVAVLKQK